MTDFCAQGSHVILDWVSRDPGHSVSRLGSKCSEFGMQSALVLVLTRASAGLGVGQRQGEDSFSVSQ